MTDMDLNTLLERVARLSAATKRAKAMYEDVREERDAAIDAAEAAGIGVRETARAAELAPVTVLRICALQEARRQSAAPAAAAAGA